MLGVNERILFFTIKLRTFVLNILDLALHFNQKLLSEAYTQ